QRLAVAIVDERAGLANQPVDDVTILDVVTPFAPQTRQGLHLLLGIPHFQGFGSEAYLHALANETPWHRVGVVAHPDGAEDTHACGQPLGSLQTTPGQPT